MSKIRYQPLALALLCACAATTQADDEGVYGPAAPPDSAFIRVYNATASPDMDAKIADKVLGDIGAYGASEFVFLPPGTYTLSGGAVSKPVTLKAGRFHTAVVDEHSVRVIDNERYANRLKAELIVYNLVDGSKLSLRTPDGRGVVENVGPNTLGTREVNAVRSGFALYDGDKRVADVRAITLERGHAFSLFVSGNKDSPVTSWVVN